MLCNFNKLPETKDDFEEVEMQEGDLDYPFEYEIEQGESQENQSD